MSDCSTQAMMPKEPPRTCGMCDRYYNVRPIMRQGACALDGLDENGCAPIHKEDDKACGNWREIEMPLEQRYKQLEQRYQQLEQVALEMYKAIAPMHEHCNEGTCQCLGDMGWPCDICCNYFRDKLIELGVGIAHREECVMDESTMICETVWDEAPSHVVFKGHDEWGAYVPERTCENLYALAISKNRKRGCCDE